MGGTRKHNKDSTDSNIELKSKYREPKSSNIFLDEVFVQIGKDPSSFIYDYAMSDTSQELAGVLLGHYTEKDGRYRIKVEAAIEALYTEAAKGSVKFTHKSWEYINEIKEEKYPNLYVVGWFHTHPGFGIFLSEYDMFIQQNFFNLPWQIAYVVDPLAGQHGFFGWYKNKIEKVPFQSELEPVPVTKKLKFLEQNDNLKPKMIKAMKALPLVTLLLLSGYLLWSDFDNRDYIGELEATIMELQGSISGLEVNMLELEENLINLKKDNENLLSDLEVANTFVPIIYYKVVEGDTLWSISERYYGSGHYYIELAIINRIKDPDLIARGRMLLIPQSSIEDWGDLTSEY